MATTSDWTFSSATSLLDSQQSVDLFSQHFAPTVAFNNFYCLQNFVTPPFTATLLLSPCIPYLVTLPSALLWVFFQFFMFYSSFNFHCKHFHWQCFPLGTCFNIFTSSFAAFDGFLNTPPFVVFLLHELNILEQFLAETVHSKPTLPDIAFFHVLLSKSLRIWFVPDLIVVTKASVDSLSLSISLSLARAQILKYVDNRRLPRQCKLRWNTQQYGTTRQYQYHQYPAIPAFHSIPSPSLY